MLFAQSAAWVDRSLFLGTPFHRQELGKDGAEGRLGALTGALSRASRLAGSHPVDAAVDPALFEEGAERALFEALAGLRQRLRDDDSIAQFVEEASVLIAPLQAYFENVFVMAEAPAVRTNRLSQLAEVAAIARPYFDLTQVQAWIRAL